MKHEGNKIPIHTKKDGIKHHVVKLLKGWSVRFLFIFVVEENRLRKWLQNIANQLNIHHQLQRLTARALQIFYFLFLI